MRGHIKINLFFIKGLKYTASLLLAHFRFIFSQDMTFIHFKILYVILQIKRCLFIYNSILYPANIDVSNVPIVLVNKLIKCCICRRKCNQKEETISGLPLCFVYLIINISGYFHKLEFFLLKAIHWSLLCHGDFCSL